MSAPNDGGAAWPKAPRLNFAEFGRTAARAVFESHGDGGGFRPERIAITERFLARQFEMIAERIADAMMAEMDRTAAAILRDIARQRTGGDDGR